MMKTYKQIVKKNIFLILIMLVLMFFTYGWWLIMPFFIFPSLYLDVGIPPFLIFIIIFLSIGVLFSLFFVPLHWSFAKEYARIKDKRRVSVFFLAQGVVLLGGSILAAIAFLLLFYFFN